MGLFRVNVQDRSPLAIQLVAGAGGALIVRWEDWGSNTVGQTTLPVLYRPSRIGIGRAGAETAFGVPIDFDGKANYQASLTTVFSVYPSLPQAAGQIGGPVIPFKSGKAGINLQLKPGEAVVLWASTDFGGSEGDSNRDSIVHTWSGGLEWIE